MLSLGQKVVAIAAIGFLDLIALLFFGILGLVPVVVSLPLAIAILRR